MPEDRPALEKWLDVFGVETMPWPEGMPKVMTYRSGQLPDLPGEEDQKALTQALKAAVDYAQNPQARKVCEEAKSKGMISCATLSQNGKFDWKAMSMSGQMGLQFPSPALDDELAARRLRKLPVSGAELRCAVRRLPMLMDDGALNVPTVMIMADDQRGVVGAPMVSDYEKEYGTFAGEYIGYVEEFGRPRRILATDPRTFSLLSGLAAQMSTPISRVGSMPEINDAVDGLMEFLKDKVASGPAYEYRDDEEAPETDVPGVGGVLYDGFEGTMEEVGQYLLTHRNSGDPALEDKLLIRVTYPEDPAFWLYAAVKTDAALRHIDNFIRSRWVECCGHASYFEIDGVMYTSNTRILPGKSMNAKVIDVMKEGAAADYEYDMGTPTDLKVEIIGQVRLAPRREKVLYLAQNYMPRYKCVRCGRRAELVARPGMEPIADSVICARCSREESEIGAYLPLLNSPRTGVCGYGMWFDGDDDE